HISASEISFQENADGSQHPIIQIITPLGVSLDSLQIAGYFIFDLDLTDSFSALSQYQNDDAIAYLVDQEGLYWAAASPEQGLVLRSSEGLTGLRDAETKTVLAGELQSRIDLNHAGEEYLGVTERIYPLSAFPETRQIPAWTLLLAQPHDSIHGAISSLRFLAVVIFLGLFLLTALFIWLHSGYLLKEIGTFQRAFQRVSHGDLSTQLRLESSNEFNHAADDFNEMTDH